jgi:hypothetical protein
MKRIIRLTESDLTRIVRRVINERQYLNEGSDNAWIELTVTVPMTTNKSGQEVFDNSRMVVVQATNWKGEGSMETLDLYKSIASIKLDEFNLTGRAFGRDKYQFMVSDRKLQNFLVNNIGKNYTYDTSYSNITMNLVAGGQKSYHASVKYVKSVTPAQK